MFKKDKQYAKPTLAYKVWNPWNALKASIQHQCMQFFDLQINPPPPPKKECSGSTFFRLNTLLAYMWDRVSIENTYLPTYFYAEYFFKKPFKFTLKCKMHIVAEFRMNWRLLLITYWHWKLLASNVFYVMFHHCSFEMVVVISFKVLCKNKGSPNLFLR